MSATITIILRKDKINRKNQAPVYIRITKNRKTHYITTGVRLEERFWDTKYNKVKSTYPNSVQLNNYLNKLQYDYQDKMLKEQTTNNAINARELKRKINGVVDKDFFEVANELMNSYKDKGNIGTYDAANSLINKIKIYSKANTLEFADITPKYLSEFEKYMRTELNNRTNTINTAMRFIRRIFNRAYKLGYIEHEIIPFSRYKLTTEKTERAFLTEQELKKFSDVECIGKHEELYRDIFTFCANCGGIRISDTLMLQKKHFTGTHLSFIIQKTNRQFVIKVPEKSIALIKKYLKHAAKPNEFIFPALPSDLKLDNPNDVDKEISKATARINKGLKKIAQKAGIEKKISTHCARHSFACMALRKGISIDKVSKLLAHARLQETQIYARLVSQELDNAMELFN